jgi:endoglucanase
MSFEKSMLIAGLAAAAGLGCGSEPKAARTAFVHVQGDRLVDPSGAPLALEGIALGGSEEPAAYAELAKMGLNYVRFYFDASMLEDEGAGSYDAEALARLDDNVARARDNGLYLVLAMSVPPGGTPINCGNDAFWDSPEHQERFVDLWRMLAARYAHEPTIAGYALLDPPNPNRSLEQWQGLAQRVTQAIREVDREHMLNIERALSVNCKFDAPLAETFVRLDDPNVIYEFNRLQPWSYVAQLTALGDEPEPVIPEYGPYPDETRSADAADWLYTPQDTRPSARQLNLKPDETEWTEKTFYYTVTDPRFLYAVPVLQADDTSGKAYFDDILIEELDHTGEARVVANIEIESRDGWYFWEGTSTAEVKGTGVVSTEDTARHGQASVAISGTTGYANLAGQDWSKFLVTLGSTYRVTSWVKGENIAPGDLARVRLDFWGYLEPAQGFNRKTLEALFTDFRAWGRAQGVPMAVSLFGTARPSFENDRGGLVWASDMIDIMREQQLGWAYWGYRDENFGVYTNPTGVPDPATVNQPLVALLTEKRR